MIGKTKVEITISSEVWRHDYKKGEKGYIDGYVKDKDGYTFALVVINKRVVEAHLHHFKVIKGNGDSEKLV